MNLGIRSACCAPSDAIKIKPATNLRNQLEIIYMFIRKLKHNKHSAHTRAYTQHTHTNSCPYVTLANSIKGVNLHRKHRETLINCAINEAKSAKRIREQFTGGHMHAFSAGTVQPAHEPADRWEQLALAGSTISNEIYECEKSLCGKTCVL